MAWASVQARLLRNRRCDWPVARVVTRWRRAAEGPRRIARTPSITVRHRTWATRRTSGWWTCKRMLLGPCQWGLAAAVERDADRGGAHWRQRRHLRIRRAGPPGFSPRGAAAARSHGAMCDGAPRRRSGGGGGGDGDGGDAEGSGVGGVGGGGGGGALVICAPPPTPASPERLSMTGEGLTACPLLQGEERLRRSTIRTTRSAPLAICTLCRT